MKNIFLYVYIHVYICIYVFSASISMFCISLSTAKHLSSCVRVLGLGTSRLWLCLVFGCVGEVVLLKVGTRIPIVRAPPSKVIFSKKLSSLSIGMWNVGFGGLTA